MSSEQARDSSQGLLPSRKSSGSRRKSRLSFQDFPSRDLSGKLLVHITLTFASHLKGCSLFRRPLSVISLVSLKTATSAPSTPTEWPSWGKTCNSLAASEEILTRTEVLELSDSNRHYHWFKCELYSSLINSNSACAAYHFEFSKQMSFCTPLLQCSPWSLARFTNEGATIYFKCPNKTFDNKLSKLSF
jgi:hypothetical protein